MPSRTWIRNIARLVAIPEGPVPGRAEPSAAATNGPPLSMGTVPIIPDAALLIEDDRIAWFGRAADDSKAPGGARGAVIDAAGGVVTPGLVDCHTHVVFAGDRADEYVRRIGGATYLELLEAGGGIRSTMRAVRAASVDDLVRESLPRLNRMLAWGATTVEIKSGYGLSPADELKMLEAIRRLRAQLPIELVPTYLGAHAVPPEFEGRADDYLDAMTAPDLLARIRDDGLAEFADVFCERGAFTLDQTRTFLTRCAAHGLVPKVHAEQISRTGAAALGCDLSAASVDHLECIDDEGIERLGAVSAAGLPTPERVPAGSNRPPTIPVLLPGCTLFLGGSPPPARRLLDAGLPVALATDCNPGSSMIESLPLIMSLGCSLLRMTPLESLVACTANAAAALRRADRLGGIQAGMQADLLILDLPEPNLWPYRVGVNPVRKVFKAGRVVCERRDAG